MFRRPVMVCVCRLKEWIVARQAMVLVHDFLVLVSPIR